MVALSAAKVSQFITQPDTTIKAILIYGPDTGLVRENTALLAKTLSQLSADINDIIAIDDMDLSQSPDRLAVEMNTMPMFGGSKIVRLRAGQKANAALVEPFLKQDLHCYLLVEAGDLKKGAKLRALFERHKSAYALPCYADDTRSLGRLIDEELAKEGASIGAETKLYLQGLLGADRALSRAELQKLMLYVQGQSEIHVSDIDAVIGDASNLSIDQIIYACAQGQLDTCLRFFDRALAAGNGCNQILFFLNKHFMQLNMAIGYITAGDGLDAALRKLRPPVHFKRQNEFKEQLRFWSLNRTLNALELIQQTTSRCRGKLASTGEMERLFVERLLLNLAQMSGQVSGRKKQN